LFVTNTVPPITSTLAPPILLYNVANAVVSGNTIIGSIDYAPTVRPAYDFTNALIHIYDGSNAVVRYNKLYAGSANSVMGIYVNNHDMITITKNEIDAVTEHGIFVRNSEVVEVTSNKIRSSLIDGIYITSSTYVVVQSNTIDGAGGWCITIDQRDAYVTSTVVNPNTVEVTANTLYGCEEDGILVWNSAGTLLGGVATITSNIGRNIGDDFIAASFFQEVIVSLNKAQYVQSDGIAINNVEQVNVLKNQLKLVGQDCLSVTSVNALDVENNRFELCFASAISLTASNSAQATLHPTINQNIIRSSGAFSSSNPSQYAAYSQSDYFDGTVFTQNIVQFSNGQAANFGAASPLTVTDNVFTLGADTTCAVFASGQTIDGSQNNIQGTVCT